MNGRAFPWIGIVLFALPVVLASCTDQRGAVKVLSVQGYTDVTTTGYRAFCCPGSSAYSTGFEATAPNGAHVSGCVCSELFGGSFVVLK